MSAVKQLSERLSTALDQEYAALLDGDLEKIAKIGAEKVQVLEEIGKQSVVDMKRFVHLREHLLRNQLLTQSAIAGMRKAVSRSKEINDVTTVLRTYGSNGQKSGVKMRFGQTLSKRS